VQAERNGKKNLFFSCISRGAAYLARGQQDQQGKVVQAERNGKKNLFFSCISRGAAYLARGSQAEGIITTFLQHATKKKR
jgi:hypothetical protein